MKQISLNELMVLKLTEASLTYVIHGLKARVLL